MILTGDSREQLRTLPSSSVNCCVTSPPYFGLRDYGVDGQMGLELSPEDYVANMVDVFREVKRVLKDDGTLWLNLGDSYAKNKGMRPKPTNTRNKSGHASGNGVPIGLKPKDIIGIPWRVAFALQADGWYLRSDIIWHKPNAMPESVTDRPTKAHEYIFLLSKSQKYYYDADAIMEPLSEGSDVNYRRKLRASKTYDVKQPYKSNTPFAGRKQDAVDQDEPQIKKNRRTVWTVSTRPFKGAHFATFPLELIEPCILAGCPISGTVIDPFFGAGTIGVAATKHSREYIGIELNPAYVEIASKRLGLTC